MGAANCQFNLFRRAPSGEKKPKIAGTFGPGSNVIMQPRGDNQFGDSWSRTGSLFSGDTFEHAALGDWDHQHSGGNPFAWRIATGKFKSMAKKQFFEPDRFWRLAGRESQGAGTEPADGPGGNFE